MSTTSESDTARPQRIEIFLDSSALIAGIVSPLGAARALLLLGEEGKIHVIVSEQVITEVERNISRKAPQALPFAREMLLSSNIRIVRDPDRVDVRAHLDWMRHAADVPILLAAARAKVGFLATLNTKHFIDDPDVARHSGLRIGTPGDALAWVRRLLEAA